MAAGLVAPAREKRSRRIWPILAILAVGLFYFRTMVLLQKVPYLSDIKSYYYPAWAFFSNACKSGGVPLWVPGIYCGFPLFADSEMALLYPLSMLFLRLPATAGFNYYLVIHYLLGGWFTYLYCRRLGLSRPASTFAAVPFTFGGFYLSHLVHPNVVATAAWMPLFLYFLERAMAERKLSFFTVCGGVLGLQCFTGFLMIPLMEVILGFFYAAFYPVRGGERRARSLPFALGGMVLAAALGACLGMAQNLPSYFLVQNSYRMGGLNEAVSNIGHLPAAQFAGLFIPRLFGRGVAMGSYIGAWTFEETYGYIGMLPILFAPAALLRPRRRHAVIFAWVGAISLLLCLGNQGLLWPLLRLVPGFNVLKGSSRFLLTLNLAVAVLGAMGFERWRAGEFPSRLKRAMTRLWVTVAALAAGLLAASLILYRFNPLHFRDFLAAVFRPLLSGIKRPPQEVLQSLYGFFSSLRMDYLFPLAMLAIFLFLLRGATREKRPSNGKVAFALGIAVIDVIFFSSSIYGFVSRGKVEYRPPVVDVLAENSDGGRVAMLKEPKVSIGEYSLCPNQLLPYGLDDAFGFSTIPPARLDRFLAFLDRQPSMPAYELLGVSQLFSNLVSIDGLPYDLGMPFTIDAGMQAKYYVYPDVVGEQLRIILDGRLMELESSGTLYLGINYGRPSDMRSLAVLRLDKQSGGGDYDLEVISGKASAFIHRVSFKSPGYGRGRQAMEIRVSIERVQDAEGVSISTICDSFLEGTRILAVEAVDRRGNGLPLTRLPIAYLDRDHVVYRVPDPMPPAFFAWEPVWAENWRKAVDAVWRGEAKEGRVVLLNNEIDEQTRVRIDSLSGPGQQTKIEFGERERDAFSLRTSNDSDAVLVLSLDYLPGWKARVDGEETPVFSGDGFFSAIYLPAGDHLVELSYTQPGLALGSILSSLAAVLLATLFVFFRRREGEAAGAKGKEAEKPLPPPEEGSISAFFPCYNDSATLAPLVEKALAVLGELTDDYEVIIVDDGSRDDSGKIADDLASRYPQVRVVHHERNRGYGGALQSGIKASTKKWVFYTDSDGQYDVGELRKLYSLSGAADVVNGYKVGRHDPWYRVILGKIYNAMIRRLFAIPIRDVDCDFRLMRGDLVRGIELHSDGGAICVEMIKGLEAAGAAFAEVPVSHRPREAGKSQFFSLKNLLVMVGEDLALWYKIMVKGTPGE
jgi:hypothetical protein